MQNTLLIELHYLPCLEYFTLLLHYDRIQLEKHEHYVKQSYRNRCYINTARGVEMLVIPLTDKHGKVAMKDLRIDYSTKWQNNHWRTLESAYRKAPFYEHYADEIKKRIYAGHEFLYDLNKELLSFCLKCVQHQPMISESETFKKIPDPGLIDLRSTILAKIPFSNRTYYKPIPYYQVFGNQFVANLSLLDLLFCEGPKAGSLLITSQNKD